MAQGSRRCSAPLRSLSLRFQRVGLATGISNNLVSYSAVVALSADCGVGSLTGKYDASARRDRLGGGPNRVILGVDVAHELSDCLVSRELHS
jgi:hypothetical protein